MAMTADKYGYRQYLKEKGLPDDQISYDNGNVMVKGKYFDTATPESDGSTYNTRANLDRLYGNYNRQSANDEVRSIYKTFLDRTSKPAEQFKYDPNSDPAYQSALSQAQANAGTAQNNTLARLRASGQGKSSYSETVANQIAQKEMSNVANTIQPQLMSQAYKQYLDHQNQEDKQTQGLLTYANALGGLNQQDVNNDRLAQQDAYVAEDRGYANQDRRIARAKDLESRYATQVNPTDDYSQALAQVAGLKPVAQQKQEAGVQKAAYDNAVKQFEAIGTATPEIAQILGIPEGTTTQQARYQQGQLGIQQQNASASAARANTTAARESRLETPKPAAAPKALSYKQNPDYAQELDYVYSSPDTAVSEITKNVRALTDAYGTDGYNALLSEARRVEKAAQAK